MDREDCVRCANELEEAFHGTSRISGAGCLFAAQAIRELLALAEKVEERAEYAETGWGRALDSRNEFEGKCQEATYRAESAEKRANECESLVMELLGDTYDLDRLRELVEADRDGRCVVFPCKVGDTVWNIRTVNDGKNTKEVYEAGEIKQMSVNTHGAFLSVGCYRTLDAERIGKTAFTTREAAEQALKEVEKDG